MLVYEPPLDDIHFLLKDVFNFDGLRAELSADPECDTEFAGTILNEAGRFCRSILEPINLSGDIEGCFLKNGVVVTPKGFAKAYAAFVQAGWPSLSCPPAYGGQGLPKVLQVLLDEMISSCNLAFGLFPGLTRGAIEAISAYGSHDLKALYLPQMVSGKWTGVMALTEAAAGTDLSLIRTQATPDSDGSYKLRGSKIFISSGDHDFGGNIVHLVLARLPDAPLGVKGISLFLAPKFLPGSDDTPSVRNEIWVGSLESKMGIHAQPTCVINYDDAKCWLVGEPNCGLQAMFTMMNAERVFVGIQGLGIAEAAYQKAAAYAKERLQGRSLARAAGAVPIIEHADVRRMLLTMRSFVEAGRALGVWIALQMEKAEVHPLEEARRSATNFVALLTPVIKAAFTDYGFEAAVLGQQVFGGHGYIKEWGVEQLVRDARITQIYEGTNGVQALDLVSRKLFLEDGKLPNRFFDHVKAELEVAATVPECRDMCVSVLEALDCLANATKVLQERASMPDQLGSAAYEYMQLFALVAFGWMWMKMAKTAIGLGARDGVVEAKPKIARFFVRKILPRTRALVQSIASGAAPIMALPTEAF